MSEVTQETITVTNKVIVFGKEYQLPTAMDTKEIKANLVSVVRELDGDMAQRLESENYSVKVEDRNVVVYREAHFG